jgi:hypothetical protein
MKVARGLSYKVYISKPLPNNQLLPIQGKKNDIQNILKFKTYILGIHTLHCCINRPHMTIIKKPNKGDKAM